MKTIPASALRTAAYPLTIGQSPKRPVADFRKIDLFGLKLSSAAPEYTASHIVEQAGANQRLTINFINAHCVNLARRDAGYRHSLGASDMLLPDGIGVEIAARMCGAEKPENLNGTDLFPLICARAAAEGTGLFMLGGLPGVADAAAAWACGQWPSLRIRGTHDGYFDAADENALIERINASGAGILFVGFGAPLQEDWIARNRHRLQVPVVMGVGGLFDYYSGRIPRAPKAVRALRSEWIWRLAMEPRRMANRYLVGNASFLVHATFEAARVRGFEDQASAATKRMLDIA
ncbi:MAG: WecB/TagA/CpsF family glycosyltransferase, partial [Qipengyuania sp.]